MKVLTVLGTRPEIIRLSQIIRKLDQCVDHKVVHTGQNFDHKLSEVFFQDLKIRKPDYFFSIQSKSAFEQIGQILVQCEKVFTDEKPDRILILGDTNSGLSAIVAKRMGIPVFHMEAGNRCYDHRVPEETNRKVIDHSSDVLLPYTERSRANLLAEGIAAPRIYVTGNPIAEVIKYYDVQINQSKVLSQLGVKQNQFFLVTVHRAENVDSEEGLMSLLKSFQNLADKYKMPILISTHPRTKSQLDKLGSKVTSHPHVKFLDPFNFFDFIHLEKTAFCVLSDSGTVQEECSLFGIPNVTLRESTERPETLECGSNFIAGLQSENVLRAVEIVTAKDAVKWVAPPEYQQMNVSDTVVRLMTSKHLGLL